MNDDKLKALYDAGYTGSVDDAYRSFLLAQLGKSSGAISELEQEWLGSFGVTGSIQDRWNAYLSSLSYEGSLADKQQTFWKSGTLGGVLATSVAASSNALVTNVQRVAPDGTTLNGIRITGNGSTFCTVDLTIPSGTYTGGRLSLLLYSDPSSNGNLVPTMSWFVATSLSYTKYYNCSNAPFDEGWRVLAPADAGSAFPFKWASTGSPAWGTDVFTNMRLRLNYSLGQAPWIEFYEVAYNDDKKSTVCFTFDDGYESAYLLAAPLLESYGMRGTFSIQADTIGTFSKMTITQLLDLVDRGHEVVPHGPIGAGDTNIILKYGGEANKNELAAADVNFHRNYLSTVGAVRRGSNNIYVWPQGADEWSAGDSEPRDTLRGIGIIGARTTGNAVSTKRNRRGQNAMYMSTLAGHSWTSEAAEPANIAGLQTLINYAASDKSDLALMFHQITEGTPTTALQIKTTNLEALIQTVSANIAANTQQTKLLSSLLYETAKLEEPALVLPTDYDTPMEAIYAAGRTGPMYDLHRADTLYTTPGGGTLCGTPGNGTAQYVGAMLDLSQGLEYGSDLKGSFVTGLAGTQTPASYNTTTGEGTIYRTDTANQSYVEITGLETNSTYEYVIENTGATNLWIRFNYNGAIWGASAAPGATTTLRVWGSATHTIAVAGVAGTGTFVVHSVKKLPGIHATSIDYTTTRPQLVGRVNELLATATLATQNVATVATTYTLFFTGTGSITLSGTATGTYTAGTHEITTTAGTLTLTVSGSVTTADLRAAGRVGLPQYQDVTSAEVYADIGYREIRQTGTQGMLTATFNPNSNTVTIAMGMRKTLDDTVRVLAEHTTSIVANNNSWTFYAPAGASATVLYGSKGTTDKVITASGLTAPITCTVVGQSSTSSPYVRLYINGALSGEDTTTQGTPGNYAAAPTYIMNRGGTGGRFRGGIVGRYAEIYGSELSSSELAAVESWINAKAKAY